jgi:hypothetical protein
VTFRRFFTFLTFFWFSFILVKPLQAAIFDHSVYDSILRHYVHADGWVDYDSIRENSLSSLDSYFERLGEADLSGWSREERLAFWINAYNAHVLALIAAKPQMKKVSEDFELFNAPFKIAGQTLTLNDVEHRILRNRKNPDNQGGPIANLSMDPPEPLVHFALVRGTVNDPPLRNFAYTAENVKDILEENTVAYANSIKYVDVLNEQLRASALFRWVGKDFDALGGWRKYLSSLIDEDKRADAEGVKSFLLDETKKPQYSYDWTLNDIKNNPTP